MFHILSIPDFTIRISHYFLFSVVYRPLSIVSFIQHFSDFSCHSLYVKGLLNEIYSWLQDTMEKDCIIRVTRHIKYLHLRVKSLPLFHIIGKNLLNTILIIGKIRVKLFHTIRTNPMTEFCFGMITDIGFDLTPITFIIAYLFTGCADRQKTAQHFDL